MADDQDQSSKTEEPTERKLSRLREEGNVPQSKEVNNLFAIFGMLLMIGFAGPWSMSHLMELMGRSLQEAGTLRVDNSAAVGAALASILTSGMMLLLPLLILMLVIGYIGGIVQSGLIISTRPIQPNLEKISPLAGMKRMFSLRSVAELLKAILKFSVIGGAMVWVVMGQKTRVMQLADAALPVTLSTSWKLMLMVVGAALAIMVFMAALDYLFQRSQYLRQHRMTRQELKDEMRESEGDPHIKQRQRQLRRERARKRMMAAVPKADVVITNPTHYAVALAYKPEEGDAAPTVVAKGVDNIAVRIREVAVENNIPLYEDPPLARALYAQVEIDQEIPLQLYEVVAKVIAFVMDLKRKKRAA
jgi:flagellar biosynthetic protein FlhB